MNKDVYIAGAGGQARALIVLLEQNNYKIRGIYDDTFIIEKKELINNIPIIGNLEQINQNYRLLLAIGNNERRQKLYLKYLSQIISENCIHPMAHIENLVSLGKSNQIFAKVFINSNVSIGNNNIINTGVIIEHEAIIGNHCHISVASVLCGRVKVGDCCFIGAGAVVIDKISICDNVIIGANSTVTESITESGTYIGSPAKKIK